MGFRSIPFLICALLVIIYELYLVGVYKYEEFKTNQFIISITELNAHLEAKNREKEKLNYYIRTNAYQTYVAKSTQNKKLLGEEIINIVNAQDVEDNKPVDVHEIVLDVQKKEESPTAKMTNPEKWWYYAIDYRH